MLAGASTQSIHESSATDSCNCNFSLSCLLDITQMIITAISVYTYPEEKEKKTENSKSKHDRHPSLITAFVKITVEHVIFTHSPLKSHNFSYQCSSTRRYTRVYDQNSTTTHQQLVPFSQILTNQHQILLCSVSCNKASNVPPLATSTTIANIKVIAQIHHPATVLWKPPPPRNMKTTQPRCARRR